MDKKYWLDDPRNIKKVVHALYAVCALLLVADFFYEKHAHFPIKFEEWFGFYGWFGFIAFVSLVLMAGVLRKLLKREEDYYDQ